MQDLFAVVVHLHNDGSSALATRDWLVPVLTGLAGVGGAVAGQFVTARNQQKIEDKRGDREFALAERRERNVEEGEKRRARGVAYVLIADLTYGKMIMEVADEYGDWWPPTARVERDLPREDKRVLASWISDAAWAAVEGVLVLCANADRGRDDAVANSTPYEVGKNKQILGAIDRTIEVLENEVKKRLA